MRLSGSIELIDMMRGKSRTSTSRRISGRSNGLKKRKFRNPVFGSSVAESKPIQWGCCGSALLDASSKVTSVMMVASGSVPPTDENVTPTWNFFPLGTSPGGPHDHDERAVDHSIRYTL